MPFSGLINQLFRSARGKFWGINLHDAVRAGTLGKDTYQQFLSRWQSQTRAGTGKPIDYVDAAASYVEGGQPKFRLTGAIVPNIDCDYLATTVDAAYLAGGVSGSSFTRYARLFNKIAQFDSSASIADLISYETELFDIIRGYPEADGDGLLEVEFEKPLKGPIPITRSRPIWFTSFNAGDREGEPWAPGTDWKSRADKMRDVLGLVHFGSNTSLPGGGRKPCLLATLVVPKRAIPAGAITKRPTPLDGSGRRFKSAFGDLRRRPSDWGRTVDLGRIANGRPHRGGREIVVENFLPSGLVQFTVLGFTRVPRGDWEPINDAEFLRLLFRKRQEASIVGRLAAMTK